jgi:molybdate-binding protein
MSTDIDYTKLDKRTIERLVRQGVVDEKTIEKAMKALSDKADLATPVESSLLDDEDYDDEDEE